jgi:uncharacterized protein (TIGR03083 family)
MDQFEAFGEQGTAARAALAETWAHLAEVGASLEQPEWDRPTPCPGWSVKDQYSHVIGIERMLLGEAAPSWDGPLGDHVKNDFAASLEPWVAVRRGRPPGEIHAEFLEVTAIRLAAMAALSPEEWARIGPSPGGEVPYADFMDLRAFDSWVHEQDVRTATGRPGGCGGLASRIALRRVEGAMGFVVGKKAAAPEGSVVRFCVQGPGDDARRVTLRVRGGRAEAVGEELEPGVTLTLSALDFVRLGCGRATAGEVDAAGGIGVAGDPVLARTILASMNFMF